MSASFAATSTPKSSAVSAAQWMPMSLSVMAQSAPFWSWIQEAIPANNRWYPVMLRYVDQIAGRVQGLGGDPSTVPPTSTGIWPGLGGHGHHGHHHHHHHHGHHAPGDHEHASFRRKVEGVAYDRFGDFEAFILETHDGERHRFESREAQVHKLVQRASMHRITITVVVRHDHRHHPLEIILHGAPIAFEE
jgi:hypothetical protein